MLDQVQEDEGPQPYEQQNILSIAVREALPLPKGKLREKNEELQNTATFVLLILYFHIFFLSFFSFPTCKEVNSGLHKIFFYVMDSQKKTTTFHCMTNKI